MIFGERVNLVKNAFATPQLTVLANSIVFYDIMTRACPEIKILRVFGRESDLRLWALRFLEFVFLFSFFSFSFLVAAVIDLLLGLRAVKKTFIKVANVYHGAAKYSSRKFCSEFFTHLFKHFCAHLRLH